MEYAHKLSNRQERELLKKLIGRKPISSGSSRLVFIDPRNSRYVVKVAIGAKALRQNKLEVSLWQSWGASGYLAEIKEYGVFCVVMERLVYTYDDEDLDENYFPSDHPAYQAADWLDGVIGYTADNRQIGRTLGGNWVAYDYGFDPNHSSANQVGWADDVRWSGSCGSYLRQARELLLRKIPVTKCELWFDELCAQ